MLDKFIQIPQQQRGRGRGAQQYQGKHTVLKRQVYTNIWTTLLIEVYSTGPGRVRGFRRQRGSGRGMMSSGSSVSPMNRASPSTMVCAVWMIVFNIVYQSIYCLNCFKLVWLYFFRGTHNMVGRMLGADSFSFYSFSLYYGQSVKGPQNLPFFVTQKKHSHVWNGIRNKLQ